MSTTTTLDAAALFPDEVVTRSLVRDVSLPGGTFALITLDNGFDHTRPNTFGPATLTALGEALDRLHERAEAGEIIGVGITGKPFIFAVGADLTGVPKVTRRDQALAIGRLGHETFGKLAALPVPSFAFTNGAAMGGGVEIGLYCTYRTISSGVPAVALPECFLGLVPGWGGCYLLPNLIGVQNALKVIIENPLSMNRMLKGPQAFALGMADAMFEPVRFLEDSLAWADAVLAGRTTVSRPEVDRDEQQWAAAVKTARRFVDQKVAGAAPAPYRALELVAAARTASRDDAFAAEDEALADLLMSDELRAGLYSFDLVQKRAKRPAGAPDRALARPVTKVGIVGAGLMASQLALLFVQRLEVPVVLTDLDQDRVDKGVGYVHAEVDTLLGKGRISPDRANRLTALVTGSTSKDGFADADFVIEAVFEELAVKKQVFAEVEAVVSAQCVLATNTSSLSITEMAAGLAHPERVVGFHFFNPVAVMPLLEIIRGERTDEATLATAFATGRTLKKTCILVQGLPLVHRQPAARPADQRGVQGGRRGHPAGGRRPRVRRPRADAAVRAARPGRSGDRAAQHRDAARGLPGPVLRLREPAPGRRGRQDGVLRLARGQAGGRPRGGGAAAGRRPSRSCWTRPRCASGCSPPWRRRRG